MSRRNLSEPEWSEPVGTEVIPVRLLAPSIKPVLVKGRSMEPAIMDKAVIGVDTSDKRVVSGEVYAVLLPYEGAVVKRLYIQKDGVLIRPDNKEFPEEKLSEEEIGDSFVLGRVKWILQELKGLGVRVYPHLLRKTFTTIAASLIPGAMVDCLTGHVPQNVTGRHYTFPSVGQLRAHTETVTAEILRLAGITAPPCRR